MVVISNLNKGAALIPELPGSAQPLVVSYIGVRRAIGVSGLLLPIVLGPIGWLMGIDIQDNMSSYYHTPLRDVFVGTLCAIGIFLFCYRGNDWIENWTANLGCVFALGVALCPLDAQTNPLEPTTISGFLHAFFGGAFFTMLAFYSLVHFPSTKFANQENEPHSPQRNLVYRTSGIVIFLSTITMGAFLFLVPVRWQEIGNDYNVIFWLEWIALWAFAAAWLTKGRVIFADIAIDLMAFTQEQILKRPPFGKRSESASE